MTTTLDHAPRLGDGVYSFPEAVQILSHRDRPLTARRLRYWMNTGLTPSSYIGPHDEALLSFHDLISLEVVGRFTEAGWSIQGIRKIEEAVRAEYPGVERPFAYRFFYTDGRSLWTRRSESDKEMTELVGRKADRRHKPMAWSDAVETFAEEIRFDSSDLSATAWEVSPWVEINPRIQFGAPVVRGTRVTVETVIANLEEGSPEAVADWYDLTVDQVVGARDYVAAH